MSAALPVPTGRNEVTRRYLALNAGRDAGWWSYELTSATGSGKAADMRYHVTLGKRGTVRVLLPGEVLAWALGVADAKGHPEVVAYREGLLPEELD
jgi:hypothetical protein